MKQCFTFLLQTCALSLYGTERERHYAFRSRLNTVHESGRRDFSITPTDSEFVFSDGIKISIPNAAGEVLYNAARDFEDYLWVSMGVSATLIKGGDAKLRITLDDTLAKQQHKITTTLSHIEIKAKDERAAAQALYHLEDLMNLRRAPFVECGKEDRTMLFSPRMVHSGFACDEFPDPYLKQIAHAGMDAILIFVYDIDSTKGNKHYQDINDTIERAKKIGIDTYLYSYIHAFAHPEQGLAPFENTYGRVSRAYPQAKGFILVGESCEFPSKDPRVIPIAARDRGKQHEGDTRPMAGYFPCSDYPQWVKAVTDAIRRHNPTSDVVFWTYNWGGAKDEYRKTLLTNIQKDISLMATWAMCGDCTLPNGLTFHCDDYTQTPVEPGHYFSTEAKWAKDLGLKLYAQSCTAGVTWDFGSVPFMPVPQHWKKRWDFMVEAHYNWGLSGLMEGHHQGWYPNFVTELSKEAFTRGGIPFEKHLRMIAKRDFGDENADKVIDAWEKWSVASSYIPPSHANQYSFLRMGPAYPFNALGERIQVGIGGDDSSDYPRSRHASNGLKICRLNYADDQVRQWVEGLDYFPRIEVAADKLKKEIDGFDYAHKLFMEGAATLKSAANTLDGARKKKAMRIANLGEFMGRTCRTAVNVKSATALENIVLNEKSTSAEKAAAKAKIIELARDDYENAKAALPLVDADSRLGWEPTMDYCGGREQIEWKLKRMRENYFNGEVPQPRP